MTAIAGWAGSVDAAPLIVDDETPPATATLPAPLRDADFPPIDMNKARLGRLLFHDKILSGNRNIACNTCHNHDFGGSDGLSLGVGEGGVGVGPERSAGTGDDRIRKRIPRNALSLWNLGHRDIHVLLHDGRVEPSDQYENGFNTPAEEWLPKGLDSLLAAQSLLPMASQFEMAGNPKENEVAGAIHDRIDAAWPIIAKRVRTIPEYGQAFVRAFEDITQPADVSIVHIANALAAFIAHEWRNHDSPYDEHLEGKRQLKGLAHTGMTLFFGKAGCSTCHSGPLLTDQQFHALGLPAFGPGRTRLFDPAARDVGRMGESDRLVDAYRFRTPALRNVALTAPYGHNGAWPTLEGIIRQHLDAAAARTAWQPNMTQLPHAPWLDDIDFVIRSDRFEMARQAARLDIKPLSLNAQEVTAVVAFLHALTGKSAQQRPLGPPDTVPSGIAVD